MEAKGTSPRPGANRRAAAFTLAELATVMVMVALAAGMLLGLLTSPGQRARALKCMNNQKVMMRGMHQYTTQMRTYPLNYSHYGKLWIDGRPRAAWPRWALGGLSGFVSKVTGGPGGPGDPRYLHEGEFPKVYICPAADLRQVYTANFTEKYHACYWTNIAVRVNRGWNVLLGDYTRTGQPPGWDVNSAGEARFFGKLCPNVVRHWRSLYMPTPDSVSNPSGVVFSGDTNDKAYRGGHNALAGQFHMRPGWGHVQGFLGFSRHGGSITVSYLDGHATTFPEKRLRDHSFLPVAGGGKEATGDFMFRFIGEDGCTPDTRGHHEHNFPPKHGKKE